MPPASGAPAERVVERLNDLLASQERALEPTDHDPAATMTAVHPWVDDAAGTADPGWWLMGLALAAPVLPDFAGQLWRSLGATGEPLVDRFTEPADARNCFMSANTRESVLR